MRIVVLFNRRAYLPARQPQRRTVTVLQHNVLHWTKKRRYGLANAYLKVAPDILLLNAHGCTDAQRMKIFPYVIYQQNESGRKHDGVAIGVRRDIPHTITRDFLSETMAVTIDTAQGKLTLATSYLPPSRPYLPVIDFDRLAAIPHPTYLLGDLNPRHRIFGYRSENTVGRQLAELIEDGDWTHLGPGFKTYHCYRSMTTPDLVLANEAAYHNTAIEPGPPTSSDHVPVLLTISVNPIITRTDPRFCYKDADWNKFKDCIARDLPLPDLDGEPVGRIDEAVETFYDAINRAKEEAIPKKTYRVNPAPHTSPELIQLERELQNLREEAERTFWDRHKYADLKRLQRLVIIEGTRLKGEKWSELLESIAQNTQDPKKFWASVKRLRGTDISSSDFLQDPDDRRRIRISDPEGREALMRRIWEPVFRISPQENAAFNAQYEARVEQELQAQEENITPYENIDLARLNFADPASAPIEADDVSRVIRTFKNGRAPGTSGVKKEDLAQLPVAGMEYLARVFSACLSAGYFPQRFKHARLTFIPKSGKSATNPLNYRPISLLEAPGKVLEKLINERVQDYAEDQNIHDPQQYGFRRRRGTTKVIALVYETIATTVAVGEGSACLVMRDIEKAFDKVWHRGLKHRLLQIHLPALLTKICCHFLDGRTASIRERGFVGPAFPLLSGVPQGSCLSPTLFVLFTADTPPPNPRTHSTHFAYADDHNQLITQMTRFPGALARNTSRASEARSSYERDRKIKNQIAKMKTVTPRRTAPAPLVIDGQVVRYTQSGNLLGLRLTNRGITPQITHLAGKGRRQLLKLRRFSGLPAQTKLKLFKSILRPILEYPAVVLCAASRSALLSLQRVQSNALRWVHGRIPPELRKPTNVQLHVNYRIQPLNIRLHQLARRTWDRIAADGDPNMEPIAQLADLIGEEEEHRWWPRCRPRALGPAPAPLLVVEDVPLR